MINNNKNNFSINNGNIFLKSTSKNLYNLTFIIDILKTLIVLAPVLYPISIFLVYLEYLQYGVNILSFLDLSRIFILSIPTFFVILLFTASVYYFYSFIILFSKKFFDKFIFLLLAYYFVGYFLIYTCYRFADKPGYLFFLFYVLIFFIYPIPFAIVIHFFKYIRTFKKFIFLILLPMFLIFIIWLSYTPLIRHYNTVALFSQGNCIINNDESLKFRELFITNEYTVFYNQKDEKSIFIKNTNILSKECIKPIINFKNEDPNNKGSKVNYDLV